MADLSIRTMSRLDVAGLIDGAAAEGWNPGLHDIDAFHPADPEGYLVGLVKDEAVGGISVVRYGADFAFLGFYIVRPEWRGQGHGIAIWREGMARLEGRTVGLDGVVAQQPNYKKSGFTYAWPNFRYGGVVEPRDHPGVVDPAGIPFDHLMALDRRFFPAPRPTFLAAWMGLQESRALALVEDGKPVGLGVIRRCRQGTKVGPLYAPDAAGAERLLESLAAFAPGEELLLDVPGNNAEAIRLAEGFGLTQRFETARMYRGPAPQTDAAGLFGITTFELG